VDCVRFMYFCKLGRDLINYVPLCSYRKVIVVIGVNPSKRYDVTPEERADLTRRMLKRSATSSNVEVHGKF
jgi:phosphopantetheine adenylyltransferase